MKKKQSKETHISRIIAKKEYGVIKLEIIRMNIYILSGCLIINQAAIFLK